MSTQSDALVYEECFKERRFAISPDTLRKAGDLTAKHGVHLHEIVIYNEHPKVFKFKCEVCKTKSWNEPTRDGVSLSTISLSATAALSLWILIRSVV